MDKLEKVIKGLEHCTSYGSTCDKCDYWEHNRNEDDPHCGDVLMRDALELLKEKQPRLLTLEEVKYAEVVWNEYGSVDGYVEYMSLDRITDDGYRFNNGMYFEPSEYNESWRCWSARPTDEQMQETGWDGEQE